MARWDHRPQRAEGASTRASSGAAREQNPKSSESITCVILRTWQHKHSQNPLSEAAAAEPEHLTHSFRARPPSGGKKLRGVHGLQWSWKGMCWAPGGSSSSGPAYVLLVCTHCTVTCTNVLHSPAQQHADWLLGLQAHTFLYSIKLAGFFQKKKKNNNAASTSGQKGIHGTWGKSVLCKRSVWHSSWGNSLCWASLNCSPSFLPPIFLALPSHRKNCFKGSRVVLVAILPQASVQHRFCRSTWTHHSSHHFPTNNN